MNKQSNHDNVINEYQIIMIILIILNDDDDAKYNNKKDSKFMISNESSRVGRPRGDAAAGLSASVQGRRETHNCCTMMIIMIITSDE